MDALKLLVQDSRFWAAVLALFNVLIFTLWPDFPKPIWAAVDALAATILVVLSGKAARAGARALRAEREKWQ